MGVLALALQIYCAPLIQAADVTTRSYHHYSLMYLVTMPGILSTLITLGVILYGVYLAAEYREKKDGEQPKTTAEE